MFRLGPRLAGTYLLNFFPFHYSCQLKLENIDEINDLKSNTKMNELKPEQT